MATKKTVKTQDFTMQDIFALWKKTSKNGNTYFDGKSKEGLYLRGFFNTNKKNPKEPDLRVYVSDENKELSKEPLISMWCNVSKSGSKYLTGKLGNKRVVAFVRKSDNEKAPYLTAYYSEDKQEKINLPEEPKKEPANDPI
jgi:uncharacterized protein (DUF736 family)